MTQSDVIGYLGLLLSILAAVWYLSATLTRIEMRLTSVEETVTAIYQGAREP